MNSSRVQSWYLVAMVVLLCSVTVTVTAQNSDTIEANKKALEEADREAFESNMAMYKDQVWPLLDKYCLGCHGPEKAKGDLAIDQLNPDMKDSTSGSRWAVVREAIEIKDMPPRKKPQPNKAELDTILEWISLEMKRARRNFTRRQQFVHGNEVSHELLFGSKDAAPLHVAPRIRRHSVEIYEAYRKEQAKGFENLVGNPFTPDPRYLFKDMGSPQIDVPTTSQLLRNALTIIERQTGHTIEDGKLKPMLRSRPEFLKFVDPDQPFEKEQMIAAVELQFRRALGRDPTIEESKRFVALMERNVAEAGRVAGVRYSLAAVYMLPETIFRYELGGESDASGKTRLLPHEIAFAIAYAITDERPDAWLIADAENGKLDDAQGVAAAVTKMMNDPKLRKPRLLRFFHEYFEYPKAVEVFKNSDENRYHKPNVLVSDTDNLVRWILDRDKDVFNELMTTDRAFVNTRYDSNKKSITQYESRGAIHRSYSLQHDWKWSADQPVKLPAGTRAGILTQPSWLVAWSQNQDNHAILRGKWIRERLLGNVVPDVPITVDAQLPNEPEWTLRKRMEVTKEEYCWQCHRVMNDVGLPFETYDHFGRWRALELGEAVDATGIIDEVGDDRIDGTKTNDAVEFVRALAKSERVEQVFVRHVFRYFTGRNENLGDGPSLQEAHKLYRASGGSFKALVTSILSSDSFLYRTPGSTQNSRISTTLGLKNP